MPRPRARRSDPPTGGFSITSVEGREFAERHIAAYMYALSGECDCPACTALKPIAQTFYQKYSTTRKLQEVRGSEQTS